MQGASRPKVCYICYREQAGTVFDQFSQFVAENGFDVTIIVYETKGQPAPEKQTGRRFIRVALSDTPEKKRSVACFISRVVDIINSSDFSVVHFHNTCEYFGIIRLLAHCKAKFVYHTVSHPVSESPFRIVRRKAIDLVQCLLMDAVIIQSEELRQRLPVIRSLARSEVIPVGYNGRLFYNTKVKDEIKSKDIFGAHYNSTKFVYIGGMVRHRQLDRVIKGFAQARRVREDIVLLMVGGGNGLEEFRASARDLGVEKDIVFTGEVPHESIIDYITMADIGLSYVPINESFNFNPPLKTFEYLACGLPVIATRTVSNSKIVVDGYNGAFCGDKSADVAHAIIEAAQNPEKWQFMRKNAVKGIEDFDFENITRNRLIPLYNRLLAIH